MKKNRNLKKSTFVKGTFIIDFVVEPKELL